MTKPNKVLVSIHTTIELEQDAALERIATREVSKAAHIRRALAAYDPLQAALVELPREPEALEAGSNEGV